MCFYCCAEQTKLICRCLELLDLLVVEMNEEGSVLAISLRGRFRTLYDRRDKMLDLVEWGRTEVDADSSCTADGS